jgi:hypothetical protein
VARQPRRGRGAALSVGADGALSVEGDGARSRRDVTRILARVTPAFVAVMVLLWTSGAGLWTSGAGAEEASGVAASEDPNPLAQARARVEHHVREASTLTAHFDTLLRDSCPHFASPGEWDAYVDGEIDRLVLLAAHLEQAWVEAKEVKDKQLRHAAKAPRRRLDDAPALLEKLQTCAADNGATVNEGAVWRRFEREVPRRQAEIALPRGVLPH